MHRSAVLLFVSIIAASSLEAADLTIVSFNALHYGWSNDQKNKAKGDAIVKVATGANADAVVFQEVMAPAVAPPFKAGAWLFKVSANSFGNGHYQEFYLAAFRRSSFSAIGNPIEFPGLQGPTGFSRPPMAVQVTPSGSTKAYFVASFHAIWGQTQGQRTSEAGRICTQWLTQRAFNRSVNIALLGDWNLTGPQVTANGDCMTDAQPTAETTLNRTGATSSSYDHAVTFDHSTIAVRRATVYNTNNGNWRAQVSDHLPIIAVYRY